MSTRSNCPSNTALDAAAARYSGPVLGYRTGTRPYGLPHVLTLHGQAQAVLFTYAATAICTAQAVGWTGGAVWNNGVGWKLSRLNDKGVGGKAVRQGA